MITRLSIYMWYTHRLSLYEIMFLAIKESNELLNYFQEHDCLKYCLVSAVPLMWNVQDETPEKCWLKAYEQINITGGGGQVKRKTLSSHSSPGTCDSPNKLFSHRRDLRLSNTASDALSLTNSHTYRTQRTRAQGRAGTHERRFEK